MTDRIVLLKAIERDSKDWSQGKRVGCISKRLAGILLFVLVAVFAATLLVPELRSYSLYFSPVLCVPVMFLISELNVPGGWDEVIDRKLSSYEPRDREAWSTLRTAVLKKGKLEPDDVRFSR